MMRTAERTEDTAEGGDVGQSGAMTATAAALDLGRVPDGIHMTVESEELFVTELGQGEPTILLHGGGPGCNGWTDFGAVAPFFAADRRVLLVDLVGYGLSSMSVIEGPKWSYHARHLVGVLDALGIETANFVCSSIGGSAALCLASEYPDRVRKVVVTGSQPINRGARAPSPQLHTRGQEAFDTYYGGAGPTWDKSWAIMADLEWRHAEHIPRGTADLRFELSSQPGLVALGADMTKRGEPQDLEDQLGAIAAPVLFYWGRFDPFLVPEYAMLLADLVPRGDVYVMDDASHHPEEEYPDRYAALVKAFLE
jgi:2-hydroxy-6-oxonona-2,4-dienedioate hydrolase